MVSKEYIVRVSSISYTKHVNIARRDLRATPRPCRTFKEVHSKLNTSICIFLFQYNSIVETYFNIIASIT